MDATFEQALAELGFQSAEQRVTSGARLFRLDPNRYLTLWLHVYDDGTALLTWEFAIVDYLERHGLQLGSSESLNLFLFPRHDDRGPQDAAWLAQAIDRIEARLRALRFDAPDAGNGGPGPAPDAAGSSGS